MQIDRKELLAALDAAAPGLAKKEGVEQAQCFVFLGDEVMAYNDEVCVLIPYKSEFTGAVKAEEFQKLCRKLKGDTIDVDINGNMLQVKTKTMKAEIPLEADIADHLANFTLPETEDFQPLPADFAEALRTCAFSAATALDRPILTCIHMAGNKATSTDGIRITQYKMDAEVKEPFLVPAMAAAQLAKQVPTNYAVGKDGWLYFAATDEAGEAVFCTRTYAEEYPDVTEHIKVKGEEVQLPKNLKDILERANIFAASTAKEVPRVKVSLSGGVVLVEAKGAGGQVKERAKVEYAGADLCFTVRPEVLIAAAGLSDTVVVGERSLKLKAAKFIHVVSVLA